MLTRSSLLSIALLAAPAFGQDGTTSTAADSPAPEGLLPITDYTGDLWSRSTLTGDWGGLRQAWADRGITLGLDVQHIYQDVVDGGQREGAESVTNLDLKLGLDLMRMEVMPGALVSVRAQSRFGDTVNAGSGLLLPVNTSSAFPISSDSDGEVDFAITELNWLQFLSESVGVLAGKITTLGTSNEFMGGEGQTQFMNFQLSFSAVVAQLAPYSTLATGVVWLPNETWTVTSILMNTTDASTTSGFDDIGDGATWATTMAYRTDQNSLPGGGTFGLYYAFDGDFGTIGGLNLAPGAGVGVETESSAWALTWSGWQYLSVEGDTTAIDPGNGRQDLQGIGAFAQLGLADEDTNPVTWSAAFGISGRGSSSSRRDDTWGVGYFYNDLQNLDPGTLDLEGSTSGFEAYYDIALTAFLSLTLDVQWNQGASSDVDDATLLGGRLNLSF